VRALSSVRPYAWRRSTHRPGLPIGSSCGSERRGRPTGVVPLLIQRKRQPTAAILPQHFSASAAMYRMPNIGRSSLDLGRQPTARGLFSCGPVGLDYVPLLFLFCAGVDNRRRTEAHGLDGAPARAQAVPRDASSADPGRTEENRPRHHRGNRVAELARRARAAGNGSGAFGAEAITERANTNVTCWAVDRAIRR
jgi:hypothetical protein